MSPASVWRRANADRRVITSPSARRPTAAIASAPIFPRRWFSPRPGEYDGGELVVEDTYGAHNVKLPSGHMILLPGHQPASHPAGHPRRASGFVFLGPEHDPG